MQAEVMIDRRAHRRVELSASAVLLRGGMETARFVVQNLSAAGALLTGSCAPGEGEQVQLRLELGDGQSLTLRGMVLRRAEVSPGLFALAIAFRHRSPDTEDAIQQAILDSLEQSVASEPFFKRDVEAAYS